MAEFKIDKNVPMPKGVRGPGKTKYPWREMEIGDSFLLPAECKYPDQFAGSPNKHMAPLRFAVRKTPEGYRLWRIA